MLAVFFCCAVPVFSQTSQPNCQVKGSGKIDISCDYKPLPETSNRAADVPRIALNHAALSFVTNDDNWATVDLAFTKLDNSPVTEARPVYIEFDDDAGNNFIRRLLPSVDFRGLSTGKKAEFSEHLRIGALRPGHYWLALWIPSPDPNLKFKSEQNFLISSVGVPDHKNGLNIITGFSVTHSLQRDTR